MNNTEPQKEQEIVSLNERGTLTLPTSFRKSLGLVGKQHLIASITDAREIVLRPATVLPVEVYSEQRIAKFSEDDEALGKVLKKRRLLSK